MGSWENREKGYGSIKQGKLESKDYITAPGTTMGVGQFIDPNQRQQFYNQLQGAMMGQQPSAAEHLGNAQVAALNRGMASGAMAGGSGANVVGGMRNAAMQGADLGLQNIQQTMAMRAEEMARARAAMSGYFDQQLQMEGLAGQNYATAMGKTRQVTPGIGQQMLGGVVQGVSTGIAAGAFSDEDVKTKKRKFAKSLDEFIRKLEPYSYEYTHEPGDRSVGVMAQDVEKSKVGKTFTKEVGGVKMLDMRKGFTAALAAMARLGQRVEALEGAK